MMKTSTVLLVQFFNLIHSFAIHPASNTAPTIIFPVLITTRAPAECKEESATEAPIASLSELGGFAQAAAPYVVGGSAIAHGVCVIVTKAQNTDRPCSAYAEVVAETLLVVLKAAGVSGSSTGTGTNKRGYNFTIEAMGAPSLADVLEGNFAKGVLTWDRMEKVVLPEVDSTVGTIKAASDGMSAAEYAPSLIDGVRLYGVRVAGVQGYSEDHVVKMYADGTGFLRSTPATNIGFSSASSPSSMKRGHSGAGFKYNWRRFDYSGGFLGEPDLRILPDLAGAIASNFAVRADTEALDQLFVVGAVDHLYSFGLRIIAESDGFGGNYEDVNFCGDLSGRAHDEL